MSDRVLTTTTPVGEQFDLLTANRDRVRVEVRTEGSAPSSDVPAFMVSWLGPNPGTNSVPTALDSNMHAIQTNDFQVVTPSSAWALAPGCVATYIGPSGRRFLVRVLASTECEALSSNFVSFTGAVAKNGDVIGAPAYGSSAFGEQQTLNTPEEGTGFFAAFERVVALDSGDTVQPTFGRAAFSAVARDLQIDTLSMSIVEVP